MSELCNSSTTTPHDSKFHTLLLHDIFLFFSFVLSHPLYFSYFIFFSPYLLKLLSFLSPLFLTTLLLLLSLLTLTIRNDSTLDPLQHNPCFLLTTFLKITENLRPKNIQLEKDHEDHMYNFEEFDVYKIVFDQTPTFTFDHHVIRENTTPIDQVPDSDSDCVTKFCTHEVSGVTATVTGTGEPKLVSFLALLDKFENMGKVSKKVVDEPEPPPCPKSNKAVGELQKEDLVLIGSKAMPIKIINDDCSTDNVGKTADNGGEYTLKVVASNAQPEKFSGNVNDADNGSEYTLKSLDGSSSFDSNSSLGSYGSMRKEKDWKRTLACKLFEERHNAGGEDGMDSLWETYETDLSKKDSKKVIGKSKNGTNGNANAKKSSRKSTPKKSEINSEYYYDFENEEDEDDHEDLANGICCLQALKMSSGKMNFGMGKPNLVKITKALRGIGWLHHTSKHGKKR